MEDFGIGEIELIERITVKLDTEQFNPKEDESVWLQKKGSAPFVCEVYFDNVWVCDIHEQYSHEKFREVYFKGFLKGYEAGKIRLNAFLAHLEDLKEEAEAEQKKKDIEQKVKALPSATPEEKISKEIITEIVKEQHAPTSTPPITT